MHFSRVQAPFNPSGIISGNGRLHCEKRLDRQFSATILVVDDEPSVLAMRWLLFEALGYVVLTAASGEEALNVMRSRAVDAVVLDYIMPRMNGEETARRMRETHRDLPIVLSSGCLSLPESVLTIVDASVDKATEPQALVETLDRLLHPVTQKPSTKSADKTAS